MGTSGLMLQMMKGRCSSERAEVTKEESSEIPEMIKGWCRLR